MVQVGKTTQDEDFDGFESEYHNFDFLYCMQANWIRNQDGSIYHLALHQEQLAEIIITVGDPERVEKVSRYFDSIEHRSANREFVCHTGTLQSKRLSVLSTGIGTDNIDIVMNEVDALYNVDLATGLEKAKKTVLRWIRLGTSGAIQEEIPLDSFLLTDSSVGIESLAEFYLHQNEKIEFINGKQYPVFRASAGLLSHFSKHPNAIIGNTITAPGFYAPQGRMTRLTPAIPNLLHEFSQWKCPTGKWTNLEMETSGIYGMSSLMGHQHLSISAIVANRISNRFSSTAEATIDGLIQYALQKIVTLEE